MAIGIMPELSQGEMRAVVEAAGNIVEYRGAFAQVPSGQLGFNGILALEQPIQSRIEFILIRIGNLQLLC